MWGSSGHWSSVHARNAVWRRLFSPRDRRAGGPVSLRSTRPTRLGLCECDGIDSQRDFDRGQGVQHARPALRPPCTMAARLAGDRRSQHKQGAALAAQEAQAVRRQRALAVQQQVSPRLSVAIEKACHPVCITDGDTRAHATSTGCGDTTEKNQRRRCYPACWERLRQHPSC